MAGMHEVTVELLRRVWTANAPRLVLLDFDGTLVPFAPSPDAVAMPASTRATVEALAAAPSTITAIVSGRPVDDLRARTGLSPRVIHVGLHGLEIERDGRLWTHPKLGETTRNLGELRDRLAGVAARFPGALVEDKGGAVSFHVRQTPLRLRDHALAEARLAANFWTSTGPLRRQPGNMVCEFLPDVAWTKGDAVRVIREDVARRTGSDPWCVYIGDDLTDEHAFRALRQEDVSILVGRRPSAAQWCVSDVTAAVALLAGVVGGAPGAGDAAADTR